MRTTGTPGMPSESATGVSRIQPGTSGGAAAEAETIGATGAGRMIVEPNESGMGHRFCGPRTGNGAGLRMLTIVDSFTRECPAIEVDTGLSSGRVLGCWSGSSASEEHQVIRWTTARSSPAATSSSGARKNNWLIHIQPGRPMQNGHVESFNGRFRDECLNRHWFTTLRMPRKSRAMAQEYNRERPHSGLAYRTPEEFAEICSKPTHRMEVTAIPPGRCPSAESEVAQRYSRSRVR